MASTPSSTSSFSEEVERSRSSSLDACDPAQEADVPIVHERGSADAPVSAGGIVCLGIDLESSGKDILAVGLAVVTMDRRVLHSAVFSQFREGSGFRFSRSVSLFFARHKWVLPTLHTMSLEGGVRSERDMISRSYEFIRSWQARARREGFHVRIASDNPSFDVGQFNTKLRKLGFRHVLPQNFATGKYEMVYDTKSMTKMLALTMPQTHRQRRDQVMKHCGAARMVESWFAKTPPMHADGSSLVLHTHIPDDDAACHASTLALIFSISLGGAFLTVPEW